METTLGFSHFIAQTDTVGALVLMLLFGLSLSSWYLIVTKRIAQRQSQQRSEHFVAVFWQADAFEQVVLPQANSVADHGFARLTRIAAAAVLKDRQGKHSLSAAGGLNDYLTRVLRNGLDQETARLEQGLTLLASAGSAAPYIGLFGTVWGIYHALVAIGLSGQGTLDKVAGPVGEALIMTALGLAVAIPAVLAYNYFNRCNRVLLSKLEAFAHDLITLLTVDATVVKATPAQPSRDAISVTRRSTQSVAATS